jgi:hypothetical protein
MFGRRIFLLSFLEPIPTAMAVETQCFHVGRSDAAKVTLLSGDGSLPLFLDMALKKHPEYRRT